jgi:hypothetical protein
MRRARRHSSYRFLAPEVVQTSAMDCGPALLKCLLEGFGIGISYDRLREACQTDIDGSSIDTLEEVAIELGLDAEQIMLPPEHLLLDEARVLPSIVVVCRPNGVTHFVVVWRRHGRWVQVMDPAVGRCWQPIGQFLASLYIHTQTVDAEDWREWAGSEEALPPLRRSLRGLGLGTAGVTKLVDEALADRRWRSLADLHAATGMAASLLRARALPPGAPAARLLPTLFAVARDADENAEPIMSERYRPVVPAGPNDPDHLRFRGAVLVRVRGLRRRPDSATSAAVSAGASGSLSPELAAAIAEPSARPGRDLWRLIRADGLLSPVALSAALFVAASGVVVEVVLFRSLIDIGRDLSLFDQRLAAVAVGRCTFVVLMPKVLDPLVHIAVHVVKAEGIGGFLTDRMRRAFGVALVPGELINVCFVIVSERIALLTTGGRLRKRNVLTIGGEITTALSLLFAFDMNTLLLEHVQAPETPRSTSPRGVLPLRLAEQAVFLAGDPGQPSDVLLGIIPTHVDNRPIISAPAVVPRFQTGTGGNAGIPFGKRHLGFANREGLGDRDFVLRAFAFAATLLALGRAHDKVAGRYHDHRRATGHTFLEVRSRLGGLLLFLLCCQHGRPHRPVPIQRIPVIWQHSLHVCNNGRIPAA